MKTSTARWTGVVCLLLASSYLFAQEDEPVQTLFDKTTKIDFRWSPGVKMNSIQHDIGSMIEVYAGPVFNKSFMVGLAGGVNFGHPRVNYGYFGFTSQYIFQPQRLVHWSAQITSGFGSTKDYEREKSSLFDNFWNISGTGFFMVEPAVNLELNLKENLRLTSGISYRLASGLDETSPHVTYTRVTDRDMSGINVRVGLIFGKRSR